MLFIEGTNPYAHHLNGNHDGRLVLSQWPNYGHLLYFLLIPFGLLDWPAAKLAWAVFNLIAFAAVV